MPVWPVDLPPPLADSYAHEADDVVIRTQVETGPLVTRPRSRRPRVRVRAEWLLDVDQADRWRQWWEIDAEHGARPFTWYEPLMGRPGRWIGAAPPRWQSVAARYRRLSLELHSVEEWWPGELAAPGRTVRVWDARWTPSLAADADGRATPQLGGRIGRWVDRVGGGVLLAPAAEPTRFPFWLRDAANPPHLWSDGVCRMAMDWVALDTREFGVAVACSLDPTSPPYTRLMSFAPSGGNDWDRFDSLTFVSAAGNDIKIWAGGHNLDYVASAPLTRVAIVLATGANTSQLLADDIVRATQYNVLNSQPTTGPLLLFCGLDNGNIAGYGKRRIFGLAVVSGYRPTPTERTMLSRWAMAMAGRDPYE